MLKQHKYTDIILFTTFYPHALYDPQRASEFQKALQFNLENEFYNRNSGLL